MKNLTETDRVGILLASGYTKKEIAAQTGKSINTVSKETDNLYKKTNCRNLADITRYMINRYSGIPVEDILFRAAQDATIAIAAAFLGWCAMQPEAIEKFNEAFTKLATMFTQ